MTSGESFSLGYSLLMAFALIFRSLELFFATSQNNRGEHLVDGKTPRLCRKFSSPPPLAVSRTSSPVRARKLSLTSPLNSRIGALDLSTSPASSSPTTTHSPAASPPPHTGKVPLDLSRSLSSPEQSLGSLEEHLDNPRVDLCNKLKRSIQRGIIHLPHPVLAGHLLPYHSFQNSSSLSLQLSHFCLESRMNTKARIPVVPFSFCGKESKVSCPNVFCSKGQ